MKHSFTFSRRKCKISIKILSKIYIGHYILWQKKVLPMFSIGGSGTYVKCEAFLDIKEHNGVVLDFSSRLNFIKWFIVKNLLFLLILRISFSCEVFLFLKVSQQFISLSVCCVFKKGFRTKKIIFFITFKWRCNKNIKT